MENYIEFYFDEDNRFSAKLHKKDKYRVIKNENNIRKLLQIAKKHHVKVEHEGVLRNEKRSKKIIKEFDRYMIRKNTFRILNKVAKNMHLSKKNPTIGKTLVVASIVAILATSHMNASQGKSNDDIKDNQMTIVETIDNNAKQYSIESEVDEILDNIEQETKQEETKQEQLNSMFEEQAFKYSYENRQDNQSYINAKRYEDLFEKYSNKYGLDKDLLMAVAAQESSGEHYDNLKEEKPAAGIMQIEKKVHIGSTARAYNFETGQMDTIQITQEKLNDIESNIQIGSMILRNYLENANYNIPLALQTYNFGPGNMEKVLSDCSKKENKEISELRNNSTNNDWLNYRSTINAGDSKYVEHVFSYLPNDTELSVKKRNNEVKTVKISNTIDNSIQR